MVSIAYTDMYATYARGHLVLLGRALTTGVKADVLRPLDSNAILQTKRRVSTRLFKDDFLMQFQSDPAATEKAKSSDCTQKGR